MTCLKFLILVAVCACSTSAQFRKSQVVLRNNGYDNIVIGIHPSIPENPQLIDNIKAKFKSASIWLYGAAQGRAFFRDITILVPSTWTTAPYSPSNKQLYSHADIIVEPDKKRPAYATNYKGCGEQGINIHLDPDAFTDPKFDKLIVHEWAHFRWGVFDEYPTTPSTHFYISPNTGKVEPTRCTLAMKGQLFKSDPATGNPDFKACKSVDPATGVYPTGCQFRPHSGPFARIFNQFVTASFMDAHYADNVKAFCRSQEAGAPPVPPGSLHNDEAPNKHNRMCGGRSTWDVILQSGDFTDSPSGRTLNPKRFVFPNEHLSQFRIVKAGAPRIVIAMDTSLSMMADDNMKKLRRAVTVFLSDLSDDTEVGLIGFNHVATMLKPMTRLGDPGGRNSILSSLPSAGAGGTSIGSGVLEAIKLLKAGKRPTPNSIVRIISDGRENRGPRLLDTAVQAAIATAKVSVDFVAFTDTADINMAAVAQETGGRFVFDDNSKGSTEMEDSMMSLAAAQGHDGSAAHLVFKAAYDIPPGVSLAYSVYTDSALGKSSRFQVAYWGEHVVPSVKIIIPGGVIVDDKSPAYETDKDSRMVVVSLADQELESGFTTVEITNSGSDFCSIALVVTSQPRNTTSVPVHFFSWLSDTLIKQEDKCIGIYAKATLGGMPLTGLNVTAILTDPRDHSRHEVTLLDGGSGYDTERGDGVYSRAYCALTHPGRYAVTTRAHNAAAGARLRVAGFSEAAAGSTARYRKFSEPITRVSFPGSFEYRPQGPTARSNRDVIKPARITDLTVTKTCSVSRSITLIWTATGDDEDIGKAHHYEVAFGDTVKNLTRLFNEAPQLTEIDVRNGTLVNPKTVGERERVTFEIQTSDPIQFVAIRAVDESGNAAEVSNVAPVAFRVAADYDMDTEDLDVEIIEEGDYMEAIRETSELESGGRLLETDNEEDNGTTVSAWAMIVAATVCCQLIVVGLIIAMMVRKRRLADVTSIP